MSFLAVLIAWCLLASATSFGADKTEGFIKSRTGETLIVTTDNGDKTVVLTDSTRTKDDRGLFGLEKQQMSSVVLIPGLKVNVEGTPDDQGRLVATTITVDGDDLEASQMVQAGLHPTAEQVAANVQRLEQHHGRISANKQGIETNQQNITSNQQNIATNREGVAANLQNIEAHTQRFNALTDFDVKNQVTVKFKVGSARLAPADQEQLKQLAQSAADLKGYIVEVTGYTDHTGSADINTKLSKNRAEAVVTYLVQQGNVPIRHIVAPGAMGEYGAASSNETKAGRAENRRVEVKVLVNKGIAGM